MTYFCGCTWDKKKHPPLLFCIPNIAMPCSKAPMTAWSSFLFHMLDIFTDIYVMVTVPWYNQNLESSCLAFLIMPLIVSGTLTALFYLDGKKDHAKTAFLSAVGISEVYYHDQGATADRGVKA